MNWDRGLKRITLILSIVVAIITAGLCLYELVGVLSHNKSILDRERKAEFNEYAGSLLIDEWKEAKTFDEQDYLWITWTGERLPKEPWWLDEKRLGPDDPNDPEWITLNPTAEELLRLKEQGWQTAKGEPLPLTPMGALYYIHSRKIKDLKETVWQNTIEIPILTGVWSILGFGFVWAVYAATRWGALPLYKWISVGFREDKQKDLKKMNE